MSPLKQIFIKIERAFNFFCVKLSVILNDVLRGNLNVV